MKTNLGTFKELDLKVRGSYISLLIFAAKCSLLCDIAYEAHAHVYQHTKIILECFRVNIIKEWNIGRVGRGLLYL